MSALWVVPFALFVGLHEEILFRGFFLSRLSVLCRSKAAAIVLTSAVFGSLHFYQGPAGIFQTAALGAVLAVVVTYTRTLWPAIIAHAALDTISIVVAPWLLRWVEELDMAPPSGL
jgi:membrane protease YdiL (CAAX protease family)